MSKKRPLAPPASPTDEWGIYDPAKAGMQALYSRLGRPVIRASEASQRRERRRASRPERPADGVGLALQEARRRAEAIATATVPAPPTDAPVTPPVEAAPPPVARAARQARGKTVKGSKRKSVAIAESVPAVAPLPEPPAAAPIAARVETPAIAASTL